MGSGGNKRGTMTSLQSLRPSGHELPRAGVLQTHWDTNHDEQPRI